MPVPQPCQLLEDEVKALEAEDQALRAQAASSTGAALWPVLADLGRVRTQLQRKRRELEACVADHTAALQANLVVIDLGSPFVGPVSRVAHLWDARDPGSPRDTREVHGNAFGFPGPLPSELVITVATTGAPDVSGPDFRSGATAAASVTAPIRVELLLGPEVHVPDEDLGGWVETLAAAPSQVKAGGHSAHASVTGVTATLLEGGVRVSVTGQLELYSLGKLIERAGYSAAVVMALAPTAVPERDHVCDLVMLADPELTSTGYADNLSRMLLPLVKDSLAQQIAAAFRALADRELSRAVLRAFALNSLPADVTISVRRLSIDKSGIRFQPALGTIGTTLSTFSAPPIPPP